MIHPLKESKKTSTTIEQAQKDYAAHFDLAATWVFLTINKKTETMQYKKNPAIDASVPKQGMGLPIWNRLISPVIIEMELNKCL